MFLLVFNQGEQFMSTLQDFCVTHQIENAHFSGIGAVKDLTCGYYDLTKREYHFSKYPELVEVVSVTGNIMQKDNTPTVHAHGVFTDTNNQAFGGHIEGMTIGVTLEVTLQQFTTNLYRSYDENTGLYLIDSN
jgi:predicted DNA-binding protein with PD1-like motif